MIKAVIFDMDGVLVDSEYLHAFVESETAKYFGMDISPEEVMKKYSGVLLRTEFEDMATTFHKNIPFEKIREVRDKILLEQLDKGIKSIPHAKEILEALSKNYQLGLVSSGERFYSEGVLEKLGLLNFLGVMVFGDDVKSHKPHPGPYLQAAKNLGLDPSACLVIEDSESGVKAAKSAGMKVVARVAEHNKNKDLSQADFVVEDLREIPEILEKLNSYNTTL